MNIQHRGIWLTFWVNRGFLYLVETIGMHRLHHDAGQTMFLEWLASVYLPTGQKLGVVYDVVIDTDGIRCTCLSEKLTMNWLRVE